MSQPVTVSCDRYVIDTAYLSHPHPILRIVAQHMLLSHVMRHETETPNHQEPIMNRDMFFLAYFLLSPIVAYALVLWLR